MTYGPMAGRAVGFICFHFWCLLSRSFSSAYVVRIAQSMPHLPHCNIAACFLFRLFSHHHKFLLFLACDAVVITIITLLLSPILRSPCMAAYLAAQLVVIITCLLHFFIYYVRFLPLPPSLITEQGIQQCVGAWSVSRCKALGGRIFSFSAFNSIFFLFM